MTVSLDDLSIEELQHGYDICRAAILRIEAGNDYYTNDAFLSRQVDAFRKEAADFATVMARKLRDASNA